MLKKRKEKKIRVHNNRELKAGFTSRHMQEQPIPNPDLTQGGPGHRLDINQGVQLAMKRTGGERVRR